MKCLLMFARTRYAVLLLIVLAAAVSPGLATRSALAGLVLPQEYVVSGTGFPVDFGPETITFDGIPEVVAGGLLSVTERVYRVDTDRLWLEYYFETTDGRPIWDPSGIFNWVVGQVDFQSPVYTTGLPEYSIVYLTIDGVAQEGASTDRWDVGSHPNDATVQHVLLFKNSIVRPPSPVMGTFFSMGIQDFFGETGIDLARINGFGATVLFIDEASDPSLLVGDYNSDGLVEQADLDLVLLNWGKLGYPLPTGWTNDLPIGHIDQSELDKVLLGWGSTTPIVATTTAVPEPATIAVCVMLCIPAFILVRRRRASDSRSTRWVAPAVLSCWTAAASLLASPHAHAQLNDGLIGYWPFDGNGNDLSGAARHVELFGGVGFAEGLFGQALDLHNNPSQYAQRPVDDAVFNFGSSDFTIQAWVNYNAIFGHVEQTLVEKFFSAEGPGWTLTSFRDQADTGQYHFFAAEGEVGLFSQELFDAGAPGIWRQIVARRGGMNSPFSTTPCPSPSKRAVPSSPLTCLC